MIRLMVMVMMLFDIVLLMVFLCLMFFKWLLIFLRVLVWCFCFDLMFLSVVEIMFNLCEILLFMVLVCYVFDGLYDCFFSFGVGNG